MCVFFSTLFPLTTTVKGENYVFYLRFTIAEVFSPHEEQLTTVHINVSSVCEHVVTPIVHVRGVLLNICVVANVIWHYATVCFTQPAGCKGHRVCDCWTTRDVIHPSLDHYITGL